MKTPEKKRKWTALPPPTEARTPRIIYRKPAKGSPYLLINATALEAYRLKIGEAIEILRDDDPTKVRLGLRHSANGVGTAKLVVSGKSHGAVARSTSLRAIEGYVRIAFRTVAPEPGEDLLVVLEPVLSEK